MNKHIKIVTVLLLLVLWTAFSWRWYTCGIKGLCGAETPTVTVHVETSKTCGEYLSSHIRFGRDNNRTEVAKLEQFLNDFRGESLDVDGLYGRADEAAVKRFQEAHRSDILEPWGEAEPTGYVYQTTRAKVNELYCTKQ